MNVGDVVRVSDYLGRSISSLGLICEIESTEDSDGECEYMYWTIWEDGEYSWISERDYVEILNESR